MELLFSSGINYVTKDLEKEYIQMLENDGELDNRDITKEEIFEYYSDSICEEFNNILKLNNFENTLLIGELQLWNGKTKAVKYVESNEIFKDTLIEYDELEFYKEDKKLFILLYHHDGTNKLEIKKLNNFGINKIYKYKNPNISEEILNDINDFEYKYTRDFFDKKEELLKI